VTLTFRPETPQNAPAGQVTGADIPVKLQNDPIGQMTLAFKPAMPQNAPAGQVTGADIPVEPQ